MSQSSAIPALQCELLSPKGIQEEEYLLSVYLRLSCVQLLVNPWTVACQATAPLSMGFSRQEHWNGLPFPSPRDLLNPETDSMSPVFAGRFFTALSSGSSPFEATESN